MKIRIQIKNQKAEALLLSGAKVVDQEAIREFNNISEELLPAVDRILKRNKITLADIQKIDSVSDLPESYTASRIVEAVVEGLALGIN